MPYDMHRTTCNMQHAAHNLQRTTCNMQHAAWARRTGAPRVESDAARVCVDHRDVLVQRLQRQVDWRIPLSRAAGECHSAPAHPCSRAAVQHYQTDTPLTLALSAERFAALTSALTSAVEWLSACAVAAAYGCVHCWNQRNLPAPLVGWRSLRSTACGCGLQCMTDGCGSFNTSQLSVENYPSHAVRCLLSPAGRPSSRGHSTAQHCCVGPVQPWPPHSTALLRWSCPAVNTQQMCPPGPYLWAIRARCVRAWQHSHLFAAVRPSLTAARAPCHCGAVMYLRPHVSMRPSATALGDAGILWQSSPSGAVNCERPARRHWAGHSLTGR